MEEKCPDSIEFFCRDKLLATVTSSFAPEHGEKVNIRKVTYRVIGRTWTLDYAGERHAQMVCIINLVEASDDQ